MLPNVERYKQDLDRLILRGEQLHLAMQVECRPELRAALKKKSGDKQSAETLKSLPSVRQAYQLWYSEAKVLLKQLLPDRLADFVRHYEKPKPRKDITFDSYRIEDYLQGLRVTRWGGEDEVVGPSAALPHLLQQVAIVRSVTGRFESTLFDIRQLVRSRLVRFRAGCCGRAGEA